MIMSKYRNALPQLGSGLFLTDGGLETSLIFDHGIDLPHFASCELLRSPEGRDVLAEYYLPYIETARRAKLGFVLEAPTWRANPDWGAKLGYSRAMLARVNRDGLALMAELRFTFETRDAPMVISGNIGPRGDGYVAGAEMTSEAAAEYHDGQIAIFAETEADMVAAFTMRGGVARGAGTVRRVITRFSQAPASGLEPARSGAF
jgi:homocysteine S-methyltransferase